MSDDGTGESLSPDEAFAVLGNDTRMAILRALGEAEERLAFSALYDRVEVADSGQFNYHLDMMVGHFVERTAEGYRLARPGRRVVEAVLSGAVTGEPSLDRTAVDERCQYCGAPVELQWERGGVEQFCTECEGKYGRAWREDAPGPAVERYLGRHPLPPAGVRDRTPVEVLGAAWTWGNLEILSLASGLCPRCSGTVERSGTVCESHDHGDGRCPDCGRRYALAVEFDCTNCILATGGDPGVVLAAETELLGLLTDHGINPVDPDSVRRIEAVHGDYRERIHSTDPLRAEYVFDVDGDRRTFTLDDDLQVVDTADGPGR